MPPPTTAILAPGRLGDLGAAAAQLIQTRKAQNTRDAYRRDWAVWTAYAVGRGLDLTQPTLMDTLGFHASLQETYGTASIARILATLAFFYRAFVSAGLVRTNPFDRAWLPRDTVTTGKTRAVTVDEALRVIDGATADTSFEGRRDAAILRLLYDTGARRASVATCRREDIDLDTHTLRVVVKGGKERFLEFTTECGHALGHWLTAAPPSPFVFPSPRAPSTRSINLATVNKIVTARATVVGVTHLHPHRFRAAFITDAYSAQIPERDIQTAAHHADAAMTRRYDRGVRGQRVADRVATFRNEQRKKS